DAHEFTISHKDYCKSLNLFGRVYVSEEGINGTLSGKTQDIETYKTGLRAIPGFETTQFKEDRSDSIPFARLIVKYRPEIVSIRADVELKPFERRGNHLTPAQWRNVMEAEKDYVMIDARNNYESKVGHFEGAL